MTNIEDKNKTMLKNKIEIIIPWNTEKSGIYKVAQAHHQRYLFVMKGKKKNNNHRIKRKLEASKRHYEYYHFHYRKF